MDEECVCGHMFDEHVGSFFMVCTVEDCDCGDYEEADFDDDDDE
jgi:hypothetical protein